MFAFIILCLTSHVELSDQVEFARAEFRENARAHDVNSNEFLNAHELYRTKLTEIVDDFQKSFGEKEFSFSDQMLIAEVCEELRMHEECIDICRTALKRQPDATEFVFPLVRVLSVSGKPEEAEKVLSEAMLTPEFPSKGKALHLFIYSGYLKAKESSLAYAHLVEYFDFLMSCLDDDPNLRFQFDTYIKLLPLGEQELLLNIQEILLAKVDKNLFSLRSDSNDFTTEGQFTYSALLALKSKISLHYNSTEFNSAILKWLSAIPVSNLDKSQTALALADFIDLVQVLESSDSLRLLTNHTQVYQSVQDRIENLVEFSALSEREVLHLNRRVNNFTQIMEAYAMLSNLIGKPLFNETDAFNWITEQPRGDGTVLHVWFITSSPKNMGLDSLQHSIEWGKENSNVKVRHGLLMPYSNFFWDNSQQRSIFFPHKIDHDIEKESWKSYFRDSKNIPIGLFSPESSLSKTIRGKNLAAVIFTDQNGILRSVAVGANATKSSELTNETNRLLRILSNN